MEFKKDNHQAAHNHSSQGSHSSSPSQFSRPGQISAAQKINFNHYSTPAKSLGSDESTRTSQSHPEEEKVFKPTGRERDNQETAKEKKIKIGRVITVNKKTILITGGIVVLVILLGYFLVTSLVSSQLKKFQKITETIINDDRVLIYTDSAASGPKSIVSESDLNKLSPEEREKILNKAVDDPNNIKNTTGITDSGSGSEFKPIIAGGIITGVATGTGALPGAGTNASPQATNTGAVAPATGSLQDEIEAIRNKK